MSDKIKGGSLGAFLAIGLFFVFAALGFILVGVGAGIYDGVADAMDENHELRTSLSYLATKVREGDAKNAVTIELLNGEIPALVTSETVDKTLNKTYIYCLYGVIREMYIEEGVEFLPEDGMRVMEIQNLSMEMLSEGVYRFESTAKSGKTLSVTVASRS